MDWLQALFVVFGNLAVILPIWLWARSESRSDARNLQDQITNDRREFIQCIRNIEYSINEMKIENKDFHYRLLDIERNRK